MQLMFGLSNVYVYCAHRHLCIAHAHMDSPTSTPIYLQSAHEEQLIQILWF